MEYGLHVRPGRFFFLNEGGMVLALTLAGILFPFIALPQAGHAFGTEGFARLALGLVWALWVQMGVEWGHTYYLSRTLALLSKESVPALLEGYFRYKLLSALVWGGLGILAGSAFLGSYPLALGATLYGVAWGLSPAWYFQGRRELLKGWALVELAPKASLLLLPHGAGSPEEFLFGAATLHASAAWWGHRVMALREGVAPRWGVPFPAEVRRFFLEPLPIALFWAGVGIYGNAPLAALRWQGTAEALGVYAAAERVVRGFFVLLDALLRLLLPRLVKGGGGSNPLWGFFLGSWLLPLPLWLAPGEAMAFLFGEDFRKGGTLLRILLLSVPLVALGNLLAFVYLAGEGLRRAVLRWVLGLALAAHPLAWVGVRLGGEMGGAGSFVLLEGLLTLGFFLSWKEEQTKKGLNGGERGG